MLFELCFLFYLCCRSCLEYTQRNCRQTALSRVCIAAHAANWCNTICVHCPHCPWHQPRPKKKKKRERGRAEENISKNATHSGCLRHTLPRSVGALRICRQTNWTCDRFSLTARSFIAHLHGITRVIAALPLIATVTWLSDFYGGRWEGQESVLCIWGTPGWKDKQTNKQTKHYNAYVEYINTLFSTGLHAWTHYSFLNVHFFFFFGVCLLTVTLNCTCIVGVEGCFNFGRGKLIILLHSFSKSWDIRREKPPRVRLLVRHRVKMFRGLLSTWGTHLLVSSVASCLSPL